MSVEESIKEIKQPLSMYDVFGYLMPGFFFFTLFVVDFDGSKILRYFHENKQLNGLENVGYNFKLEYFLKFIYYDSKNGFGIVPFLIFMIFCYLTGHIMASFSSFIAKHLAKRFLKDPSENLFPNDIERVTGYN
jgi:hypothetical protein